VQSIAVGDAELLPAEREIDDGGDRRFASGDLRPGLVLCVSPSLRQSRELFAKVIAFLKALEPVEPLEEDNKSSCELRNGSRIVSLPGDPARLQCAKARHY
jgi:hypothetical protein